MVNVPAAKSLRGGKRPGAGRPKKGEKPKSIAGVDLAAVLDTPPPDEIESVARQHARTAIDTMVKQLMHGASEPAKIAAANAILDRGYGKPTVEAGGDAMLPFFGTKPVAPSIGTEIREEARKFARLAVEVLHRIASVGVGESARVQAGKSLLDRGLGTVAAARLLDEMLQQPTATTLGKKEEAARTAREVGSSGRYAPRPAPPRAVDTIQ